MAGLFQRAIDRGGAPVAFTIDGAPSEAQQGDLLITAILLHRTARVFLMSHSDCATYGGLAAFDGDRARETDHHKQELRRAAELIRSNFADIDVECFFVTFEGVLAIPASAEEAA